MELHKWEKIENGYAIGKRVVVEVEIKNKLWDLRHINTKEFHYPIVECVGRIKDIIVDEITKTEKIFDVKEYGISTIIFVEDDEFLKIITVEIERYYREI